MSDIKITKAEKTRYDGVDWNNLGFGQYFSDHIFESNYVDGKWDAGEIKPYGPMAIDPANCTLHYGQTIFEGLKAFRNVNGGINIFRPDQNCERLNRSAERVCIPPYDVYHLVEAIVDLVKLDRKFVPQNLGEALYIRPVVFGMTNVLKVKVATEYRLLVITSPVGAYYETGLNPVGILVESDYVRAVEGGMGFCKTAGNYAASLLAAKEAQALGYNQVCWLDGKERKYVDEVGAMNIMFVFNDEIATPSLENKTILPGITRASVIHLANEWGMKVSERLIPIEEVFERHEKGELLEVFGTGTAAVITPVGKMKYRNKEIVINDNKTGPVSQKVYDTITGIQYGKIKDKWGWTVSIPE